MTLQVVFKSKVRKRNSEKVKRMEAIKLVFTNVAYCKVSYIAKAMLLQLYVYSVAAS